MAKPPPKADAADAAQPKSKKKLIMIAAAVLLLAGGGGAAFMMMGKKGEAEAPAADNRRAAPPRGAPAVYVTMEPFTTNLARDEGDRFIQIVMVLKVLDAKAETELKQVMPELRHRVNLILTAKKPSELATMEGRERLAEEIQVEANDVMGYPPDPRGRGPQGPVDAVLFNSFIIQ